MADHDAPLERLPKQARARLSALRHARDEAIGLAAWGSDKRRRAYTELEQIEAQEVRLKGWANGRGRGAEDVEHRTAVLASERERVEALLNNAIERLKEYEAAANHLGALCSAADRWIASLPSDASLTDAPGKDLGSLEKAQAASDRLRAEIHAAESAPIPSEEAKAIVRQSVDELAEAGRPSVARTVEAGLRPSWGKVAPAYGMVPEGADSASLPLSILAWLFRDTLVTALEGEIDAQADDSAAEPTKDRAAKVAKLRGKHLSAEIDEVATHHATHGREDWGFRRHIDIRAVLMVKDGGAR